ncbi:heavy chain of dynein [Chloropicon primus]|uniref:Heavy chain of dynein n=1 Tax=Chloropicon primus TaxID=1764295 RepID=A0A5B8MQM4_9CHLO|nr:heavy chain of dynein [Chloropicon primus]|eukprot:QDZ22651.1 heavy chain of dynein [Chloropicon primus]
MGPQREYISHVVARSLAGGLEEGQQVQRLEQIQKEVLEDGNGVLDAFLNEDGVGLIAYACASDSAQGSGAVVGANKLDAVSLQGKSLVVVVGKVVCKLKAEEDIATQVVSLALKGLNEDSLGISTSSLYYAVQNVFLPLLDSAGDVSALMNSAQILKGVQDFVSSMKTDFKEVFGCDIDFSDVIDKVQLEFLCKKTLQNETIHWMKVQNKREAAGMEDRASREAISVLQEMKSGIDKCCMDGERGGETVTLYDIELLGDTVEAFYDSIDILWRITQESEEGRSLYSKEKMKSLLFSLTCFVCKTASEQLLAEQVWTVPFAQVENVLERGSRMLTRWEKVVVDLCSFQWKGDPRSFEQSEVTEIVAKCRLQRNRIDEIREMRGIGEQAVGLLAKEKGEHTALGLDNLFLPFENLQPSMLQGLDVNSGSDAVWNQAVTEHRQIISPLESRIGEKLRLFLSEVLIPSLEAAVSTSRSKLRAREESGLSTHPHQVFHELKKYGELLALEPVKVAVASEIQTVISHLETHLENIRSDYEENRIEIESRRDSGSSRRGNAAVQHLGNQALLGKNVSAEVNNVAWVSQCERNVQQTLALVDLLMGKKYRMQTIAQVDTNLASIKSVHAVGIDLMKDIRDLKDILTKHWVEAAQKKLKLAQSAQSSSLMDFDQASGHIKLHFSDSLVSLVREARQISALGFAVPSKIQNDVRKAQRFYRHCMVLKQVANFYNQLSNQIILCQKPMLLADAVEFEQLLSNPRDSTGQMIMWTSSSSIIESYILQLQTVAAKLTNRNRRLQRCHSQLRSRVLTLFEHDLLHQRDRWAGTIREIRELFLQLEGEGYDSKSQLAWRLHWDHQIYKALEYQYYRGLEVITDTIPKTVVTVVVRHHRVQFDPPVEELHMSIMKTLKSYINIPFSFKGVSEASALPGFFANIARSRKGVAAQVKAYDQMEQLLSVVSEEMKKMTDWLAPSCVTMETIESTVDELLNDTSDWEQNYKILKQISKESDTIGTEIHIDNITISLTRMKATIDSSVKILNEAMLNSLKKKARAEKDQLEDFLKDAFTTLHATASTVEDIANSRKNSQLLLKRLSSMVQLRRRVEEKQKLLRTMGSSSDSKMGGKGHAESIDMEQLSSDWDMFTAQLQQQENLLEAQKAQLKGQMEQEQTEISRNVDALVMKWKESVPKSDVVDATMLIAQFDEFAEELQDLREQAEKNTENSIAFGLEVQDFDTKLGHLAKEIENTRTSWSLFGKFCSEKEEFLSKVWLSFRFKLHELEDWLQRWYKEFEGNSTKDDLVKLSILKEVKRIRHVMPMLYLCRGDGFEREHWSSLFTITGLSKTPATLETFTLRDLLGKPAYDNLVDNESQLQELHTRAHGEVVIREALNQLTMWSLEKRFETSQYDSAAPKGHRGVCLIKNGQDILTEISDHQALIASLYTSQWFLPFKEDVSRWDEKMNNLAHIIINLTALQRQWIYLEPVFARNALPSERMRFKRVDESFCSFAARIAVDPLVVSLLDIEQLRDNKLLERLISQLDICQRALSDFLEDKRNIFPRFFFLGDDDLLELLGQASDPEVLQAHLKKLFGGVHGVKFGEAGGDHSNFVGVNSIQGEQVLLAEHVQVDEEAIEKTLKGLLFRLQFTLSALVRKYITSGDRNLSDYPSQVLCLSEQILFTRDCHSAITSDPRMLSKLQNALASKLSQYTAIDVSIDKLLQLKIQACILDAIHHLDVLGDLISNKVESLEDWFWLKQLRYTHNPEIRDNEHDGGGSLANGVSPVSVRMVQAEFQYSFEYQGNAPKLVYTPLTDKCYLTLTQAMALGYGGNPYGPAGTGKTESVKALGQCLGRQVLVFNCDEEFNFESMGRIFVGLMRCGAWGCFDEFNRLEEDVLSAISQQIQQIQVALKERIKSVLFGSKNIPLDFRAAIFVTLNPAAKGYGGRRNLPDNLKQLFRSIAMTKPNNELIAEVLLLSVGFTTKTSSILGRKLVSLFSMAQNLLTPQQHYDWGLRALKSILTDSGNLLYKYRKQNDGQVSAAGETGLLLRALCSSTIPKLTSNDVLSFHEILKDIFPGESPNVIDDADLESALGTCSERMGLALNGDVVNKVLQLHQALQQRMGVIIAGPPGSGKSTLWKLLHAAYELLSAKRVAMELQMPKIHVMNPKAVDRQSLIGRIDPDVREWIDGVLSYSCRKVAARSLEEKSWILCDGDIDPEWIESLNSVLDDNRLLTMPNGERIEFAHNVNFLFECADLQFASPATISRCGVIYTNGNLLNDVGIPDLLASFASQDVAKNRASLQIQHQKGGEALKLGDVRNRIREWFGNDTASALRQIIEESIVPKGGSKFTSIGVLKNGWSSSREFLWAAESSRKDALLGFLAGVMSVLPLEEKRTLLQNSVSGLLGSGGDASALSRPMNYPECSQAHSAVLAAAEENFEAEENLAPELETHVPGRNISLTDSQLQAASILLPWLMSGDPLVLWGSEGSGKASLVESCVAKAQNMQVVTVHCSTNTSTSDIMHVLKDTCDEVTSAKGRTLRPRSTPKLVLLIRGLHVPAADKYGTVQLVQLIQQLITYNGLYDEKNEYVALKDIHIVCTISSTESALLRERFTSCVCNFYVNDHLKEEAMALFEASIPSRVSRDIFDCILEFTASLYDTFLSLRQDNISFKAKDILQWLRGLRRYDFDGLDSEDDAAGAKYAFVDFVLEEANRIFIESTTPNSMNRQNIGQALVDSIRRSVVGLGSKYQPMMPFAHADERCKYIFAPDVSTSSSSFNVQRWEKGTWAESCRSALRALAREKVHMRAIAASDQMLNGVALISRAITESNSVVQTGVLLTGSSGVGRKTMLNVAAKLCGYELASPKTTSNYSLKTLLQEVKTAMCAAGGWANSLSSSSSGSNDSDYTNGENVGSKVVLLLEDHHIGPKGILGSLLHPLLSGTSCLDINGLFQREELEQIAIYFSGQALSQKEVLHSFAERITQNLRIVVCLNSDTADYKKIIKENPALRSRCTTLAFGNFWSDSTQESILKANLQDVAPRSKQTSKLKNLSIKRKASLKGAAATEIQNNSSQGIGGIASDAQKDVIKEAIQAMMRVHKSMVEGSALHDRKEYAVSLDSPYRLVLVSKFCSFIWKKRRQALTKERTRLGTGLSKLSEAEVLVDKLRNEAEVQRKQLKAKQAEADSALSQITISMTQANESRKEVDSLSLRLKDEEKDLESRKLVIEEELASVQPIVDAARKAVGQIRSDHLSEIKSLKVPPDAIRDVLEGVLLVLGQTDTSWTSMKKFLASRAVKENIINFDARQITLPVRERVEALLQQKGRSFEHAVIYRVSVAAAPMAAWVKANIKYSHVLERIAPLERNLHELSEGLEQSRNRMNQCQSDLDELDSQVQRLKEDFGKRTLQAQQLEAGLKKADQMLESAVKLLSQLSDEKDRWSEKVQKLKKEINEIPVNSVLAASMIAYLMSEDETSREQALDVWQNEVTLNKGGIEEGEGNKFDIKYFLSNETELLCWRRLNLPGDDLSAENAIGILSSFEAGLNTPLIVDNSGRAIQWLENKLHQQIEEDLDNGRKQVVEKVRMSDKRAIHSIELAVRFGKILILEEVDHIEPILYPLLRKELVVQGGSSMGNLEEEGAPSHRVNSHLANERFSVQLGDKTVDYDPHFRLYLVARTPAIMKHMSASVAVYVNVANFAITKEALERQLLAITIEHDQPELENARTQALSEAESLRLQLTELEEQLLIALADSEGSLLENHALVESLNETKAKALGAKELLIESKQLQASLDEQRAAYRPIAQQAGQIYFMLQGMKNIHYSYQFNIAVFLRLFQHALKADDVKVDRGHAQVHIASRIAKLNLDFVRRILSYVSKGLYKNDRLTFAVFMAQQLEASVDDEDLNANGEEREELWSLVLGREGNILFKTMKASISEAQIPHWVPHERRKAFMKLCNSIPDRFQKWKMLQNHDAWANWLTNSRDPEKDLLDGKLGLPSLNPLEILAIISTLRPDRLESSLSLYAVQLLGLYKSVDTQSMHWLQDALAPLYAPFSLAQLSHNTEDLLAWSPSSREPVFFLTANDGSDPSQELEEYAGRHIGAESYHQLAMGQGQCSLAIDLLHECARNGHWLCLKNIHFVSSWLPKLQHAIKTIPSSDWKDGTRVFLTAFPTQGIPSYLLESSLKVTCESPPGIKKNILRTYTDIWMPSFIAGSGYSNNSITVLRAQMLFALAWFHAIIQERRAYLPHGWSKFYEFSFTDLRSGADIVDMFAKQLDSGADSARTSPQWKFLQGLLLDAVYGGRIDNPQDLEVLKLYLGQYFSDDAFGTGGKKVKPLLGTEDYVKGGLVIPCSSAHADFLHVISNVPEIINENGSVAARAFQLPLNISRSAQHLASSRVLSNLTVLESQDKDRKFDPSGLDVALEEKQIETLEALEKYWRKSYHKDASKVGLNSKSDDARNAVETFILGEIHFADSLVSTINESVVAAIEFLRGEGQEKATLDTYSLSWSEIPQTWRKMWNSTLGDKVSLFAYIDAVLQRLAYLKGCVDSPRSSSSSWNSVLGESGINLHNFFNPKSLLIAIKQQAARTQGCSIHDLVLHSSWGSDPQKALGNLKSDVERLFSADLQQESASVFNSITVQGARIGISGTAARLQDVAEQDDIISKAPFVAIGWVQSKSSTLKDLVHVPLYEDMDRTSIIEYLGVPCDKRKADDDQQWLIKSVALFIAK